MRGITCMVIQSSDILLQLLFSRDLLKCLFFCMLYAVCLLKTKDHLVILIKLTYLVIIHDFVKIYLKYFINIEIKQRNEIK